jgi:IclR family acetate operon transcriptional repressor
LKSPTAAAKNLVDRGLNAVVVPDVTPAFDTSAERGDTPTLRAFALLEFLVRADRSLTLAEIMQGFDAPKASLHRMLAALETGGLVIREPGPRNAYTIGPRLARLGLDIVTHSGPRQLRRAILARLVADIGETVNLTMLNETEVLYLDRMEAPWPLRLDLKPGSRVPLHCSASGKLLLSQLPPERRGQLVRQLKLERFTPNTITNVEMLEAELDRCADKELGIDNEEFVAGIACVAVPVRDATGKMVAAIAIHAPTARSPLSRSLDFVPRALEAAAELTQTF